MSCNVLVVKIKAIAALFVDDWIFIYSVFQDINWSVRLTGYVPRFTNYNITDIFASVLKAWPMPEVFYSSKLKSHSYIQDLYSIHSAISNKWLSTKIQSFTYSVLFPLPITVTIYKQGNRWKRGMLLKCLLSIKGRSCNQTPLVHQDMRKKTTLYEK